MALNSFLLLFAALASSTIAQDMMSNDANVTEMALDIQSDHFFCLGTGTPTSRSNFMTTPDNSAYRWGIWIQYPVLSYLDTMRKRHLMYAISRIVGPIDGQGIFDRICIAEVEQYGVSTFRESVFIKLYLSDSTDLQTLEDVNTAFQRNFREENDFVYRFLNRLAINVNTTEEPSDNRPVLSQRTVNDSVHPGCDRDRCPEGDPTVFAVVIGTYYGPAYYGSGEDQEEVTIENLENGFSGFGAGFEGRFYRQPDGFAENPRPINYGLEAGDIVFSVFGSVFLAILTGAIILGFVIHPFCLA